MSGACWADIWPEIDWETSWFLIQTTPADAGPHWHPEVRWAFEDTPVPPGFTLRLRLAARTRDGRGQKFGVEAMTAAPVDLSARQYLQHTLARALKVIFDGF